MARRSEFGLTDTMLTISGLVLKRYIHHVATLAPDYHLQSDIDERYKVIVACSQNLIDDLEVRGFSKPLFGK